jgi:transcriptional regulator with XRE-family HTH domain
MPRSQHSARYKRFCALLVETRKARGLTQAEVAHRLERPQSYVAKYEGGERRLDVVEFLEVVEALGAQASKLIRAV